MKIKVGDKVRVITGKDKGKEGIITHTFKNENKVVVEGINMIKKHMKPNNANETGGIVEKEAKINASNVMLIDPKTNKVVRVEKRVETSRKTLKKTTTKEKEEKKVTRKKASAKED